MKDVDFETIWNQGHTEAEDSGSASSNFISWVEECAAATNVEEQNETSMTIYPNPAKDLVTIKTTGDVTLYNSLGQVVKEIRNVEGQTQVSTQELSSGLYFVKSNDAVKKLIVE